MNHLSKLLALGAVALALSACGAVDKIMGSGVDNTVLPGQREDAIPGRATFPDRPDPTLEQSPGPAAEQAPEPLNPPPSDNGADCQPDDPGCAPASGDDAFSDPQ